MALVTSTELIKTLPDLTGLSAGEIKNRILLLVRGGVLPRSRQGRGESVSLSEENLADLLLSLLCPEAKFAPEWAKRYGSLISVENDGAKWKLRDAFIDQIERHKTPSDLKHGGVARILAIYDERYPYVEVDFLSRKRGQAEQLNFVETVDDTGTELRFQVDRATIISGHVFELFAEWL